MNKHKHTSRVLRCVRLLLFTGVAWLVCGVAFQTGQGMGAHGLMSGVSNMVIAPALADSSSSSDKSSNSENSDNSGSDKSSSESSDKSSSSESSSSSSDYSSATLVCESRDTVESTLGLTSGSSNDNSSSESSDSSGSDKSSSESSDSSGSDKSSSESSDSNKVTMCHYPGNSGNQVTITIDESAVPAHTAIGDTMGACSSVTQSYIESLPTCAAIDSSGSSTVTGVWVPESAVGSKIALNDFYTEVQSGSAAVTPFDQGNDTTRKSYREIHGQ